MAPAFAIGLTSHDEHIALLFELTAPRSFTRESPAYLQSGTTTYVIRQEPSVRSVLGGWTFSAAKRISARVVAGLSWIKVTSSVRYAQQTETPGDGVEEGHLGASAGGELRIKKGRLLFAIPRLRIHFVGGSSGIGDRDAGRIRTTIGGALGWSF
jgi:hypothetical protein